MSRFLRVFSIIFLFFVSSNSVADFPGVTPGSFTVTDSGTANYTLPITTPAGVNGMSPDLSVNYSSSGGNGLMGVGFQLGGFSSGIHRCGGSHATDGRASGVTYTNTDKLCLDGQRLILVKGTHFSEGAEYHTELESFTKVVYQDGNFLVYSRDGTRTWYAWRVWISSKIARWLKSSDHDRTGNIVRYYYRHIGEQRWIPKEVLWTGKGSELGNRKAVFSYKTRTDKRISYEYGLKQAQNNLIDKVTTYIGSNKIKEYRFAYAKSPVSGLSRLRYIWQCGSAGGCFPKHEFQWEDTVKGFSGNNAAFNLPVRVYDYHDIKSSDSCGNNQCNDGYSIEVKHGDFVDLNNDGFVDYVESYRSEDSATHYRKIYRNDRTKFTLIGAKPPVTVRDYYINRGKSSAKGEMLETSTYADVNGDGFVDIVTAYRNDNNTLIKQVRINNRNFTFKTPSQTQYEPPTHMWQYDNTVVGKGKQLREAYLIDVNGDGLLDWVRSLHFPSTGERRETYLNTGTNWLRNYDYDFPPGAIIDDYRKNHRMKGAAVQRTELVDLNGDGLIDLIQGLKSPDRSSYKNEVHRKAWLNTGRGWAPTTEFVLPASEYISDYTRFDQKTRLYGQTITGNDMLTRRGDFIDVNGDGLVDWVRSYRDARDRKDYKATWLNTGKGWLENAAYALKGEVIRNYDSGQNGDPGGPEAGSFFDINRDGLIDWVVAHKNRNYTTVKQTYLNTGAGWANHNPGFVFPDILMDNVTNEANLPARFGGIMDINGDGAPDYLMSMKDFNNNDIERTYLGRSKPADMVNKIINTMGAETGIFYKSMNDPSVYSNVLADSAYSLRKLKVSGPVPLVSDTSQTNGVGGKHWLKYHYYQALSDSKRGHSGFFQRRVWDNQQKIQSIKEFYQEFPATGMTRRELTYKVDNITAAGWLGDNPELLNYKINLIKRFSDLSAQGSVLNYDRLPAHLSGKYTYAPKIRRTRTSEYEIGQKHYRSSWVNTKYDKYSNPTEITSASIFPFVAYENINWANTFWKRTTTQYSNNETSWLIGMPTRVEVAHNAPSQTEQIRTTQTIYNTLGQPRWVIVEPDKPDFKVTTGNYFDDDFGNQTRTFVFKSGVGGRLSSVDYDAKGMHVISKTNAEEHTMSIVADPKCDAPKSTTDANGLVTSIIYDQFCRVYQTNFPDGTWTRMTYPSNVKPYKMTQKSKNQADVITYYDELGRDTKVETKSFDGRTITTEKRYNSKGQITRESLPYFNGGTKYWTKYEYDVIGRLKRTIGTDNSISTISYDGLTTITTNPKGQTQTTTTDLLGRVKTVRDANGKPLTYTYDSVGNLLKTRDPKGNEVKMGYDDLGRKITMDDPDMGRWTYDYDFLGQLIKQTDAKNQAITSEYDDLGRMTKRTTAEGVSTWEYDTATNGIGKLSVTMDASGYKRVHTYDNFSRPTWTNETVNNVLTKSLTTYNSNGKLNSIYYPGRANSIAYTYNSLGYLTRIYDYNHNGGNPIRKDLWVLDEMDAKGNITKEHYGNGVNVTRNYHPSRGYLRFIDSFLGSTPIQRLQYDMDAIGNLTSRRDRMTGTEEVFKYDSLNRLTENRNTLGTFSLDPVKVYTYNYDDLGNMTFRSDLGIMRYGENGYGPHAITSIQENHSVNVPENVFNPHGSYKYDANGNLTSNGLRKVFWTSFNKPKRMETTVDGTFRKINYSYGTDFQRIYKYDSVNRKSTRYYGGGSVERTSKSGITHWKYYIPIGATTLEIKYKQTGSSSPLTLNQVEKQYLFKDQLGSTDVIVNDAGNIVERTSFNPWGERRDADWTEADNEITSSSTRGFTGHEMDDEIGLVNMKARIYDPVIGRFLSPDALIPNPADLQSYNRYSYVNNNPLSFTDPSGHVPVPGGGGYKYENGNFYKKIFKNALCGDAANECKKFAGWKKITDPGLIKHLQIRIGVYSEIIKNYGGVSRGNAKETRNNYNQLAAGELAANGKTSLYQSYLDKGYAAHVIYRQLKRQARHRYTKVAISIAATAVTGNIALATESVAGAAVVHGASSYAMSGGDLRAALIAAGTSGIGGPLHSLTDYNAVLGIAAHGVVGGIASEIQGGGFAEGFVGNAVGKAITVGGNKLFPESMSSGDFHAGQFAATVGGAALAAELAGGDGALAGMQAALGYVSNQIYMGGGAEGSMSGVGGHAEGGYFVTSDGKMIPYTSAGARATTSVIPHGEFYAEIGYVNPANRIGSSWLGEFQLGFVGFHIRMSNGNIIGGGFNVSSNPSLSISSGMEHTKTY